jgi:hypothetical protein
VLEMEGMDRTVDLRTWQLKGDKDEGCCVVSRDCVSEDARVGNGTLDAG